MQLILSAFAICEVRGIQLDENALVFNKHFIVPYRFPISSGPEFP